ncbi:mechanosensitive ion channel family protein [Desulfopila aestuarii]|uniref:Small-conductance mechanosensitive channel n=1 Tax=Desulfopila aestuarii DSM 18488 TaxID=1121416 RepID=A0A1M7YCL8_9BACT|nr:mechanosensitive ion channel family protein [Desulfopila aestuarii]SHO50390.1 Small-conductance mechanosensitive channel [Desulfopila aestuarii DSM 18488]
MKRLYIITAFCLAILVCPPSSFSEAPATSEQAAAVEQPAAKEPNGPAEILASLLELRKNLKEQMQLSKKKLEASKSDAEKESLEKEISQLDKQLSENSNDFERIATGIEPALFAEKKPEVFSWKEEVASLVEPAIKELKRFTIRARQKTNLKDKIAELEQLSAAANQGVAHLEEVSVQSKNKQVVKEVKGLEPEWQNIQKRLANKLELAQRELAQLEDQEVSLVESSSQSVRNFFRDRGRYLIMALLTFVAILLGFRLLYRLIVRISVRLTGQQEERSFKIRLLYIIFQVLSVVLAVIGLFFVLYLAEDWFLLSMAIVFFLGLAWTIRQGVPRLWQEGRLMLNVGAVRENERIMMYGLPWQVTTINVFCKLVNPSLDTELRVPIENLIGLTSRPFDPDEAWFPCRKGDWVEVNGGSRAKVVSLSHEQVELVERGGRRIFYPTEAFLQACPANLSRNFRMKVPFGISYGLQDKATDEIPRILKSYLEKRMEEEGYSKKCLNLLVEFMQANSSSLDLLVIADFDGDVADICKRIERAIQKWCVECCTQNDWEIPFPQLTVHKAEG